MVSTRNRSQDQDTRDLSTATPVAAPKSVKKRAKIVTATAEAAAAAEIASQAAAAAAAAAEPEIEPSDQLQNTSAKRQRRQQHTPKPLQPANVAEDQALQQQHDQHQQTQQANAQPAAEVKQSAATKPVPDLLPVELLLQLAESKKQQQQQQQQQQLRSINQQQPLKHRQKVSHKQHHKQRITEVQKGPVKVAVLPAVAAATGSKSAAASMRDQLLESRLHRSAEMLQPTAAASSRRVPWRH